MKLYVKSCTSNYKETSLLITRDNDWIDSNPTNSLIAGKHLIGHEAEEGHLRDCIGAKAGHVQLELPSEQRHGQSNRLHSLKIHYNLKEVQVFTLHYLEKFEFFLKGKLKKALRKANFLYFDRRTNREDEEPEEEATETGIEDGLRVVPDEDDQRQQEPACKYTIWHRIWTLSYIRHNVVTTLFWEIIWRNKKEGNTYKESIKLYLANQNFLKLSQKQEEYSTFSFKRTKPTDVSENVAETEQLGDSVVECDVDLLHRSERSRMHRHWIEIKIHHQQFCKNNEKDEWTCVKISFHCLCALISTLNS